MQTRNKIPKLSQSPSVRHDHTLIVLLKQHINRDRIKKIVFSTQMFESEPYIQSFFYVSNPHICVKNVLRVDWNQSWTEGVDIVYSPVEARWARFSCSSQLLNVAVA